MNTRFLAVAAAAAALGLAGCGDDASDVPDTPATPTPSATTPAGGTSPLTPESPGSTPTSPDVDPSKPESSSSDTIGRAVGARSELATLSTALSAADLRKTLDGKGPFTVFAPNNDAFSKLGTRLDTLLQTSSDGQLTNILKYHVVEGNVKAADLTDGKLLRTLNGTRLRVTVEGDQISLKNSNGVAAVLEQDVAAANGTIHVIDAVMQPKN